jgi:hypothetical protein
MQEHMIQKLDNSGHEPAAEETPELIAQFLASMENGQTSDFHDVPAHGRGAKMGADEEALLSIDQALARLGEDVLIEPIPHRLLEVVLKGSVLESER